MIVFCLLKDYPVYATSFPFTIPAQSFCVSARKCVRVSVCYCVRHALTALCRPFLKHCTLTNKAVGLYDGPSPDLLRGNRVLIFCPLWLLVGTPSAIRPELASRRAEHSLPYSDVVKYIFHIIYYLCSLCIDFNDFSAWCGCWFVVYIRRFIYNFFMCVVLITRLLRGVGRWARYPVNHTSWLAVVTVRLFLSLTVYKIE